MPSTVRSAFCSRCVALRTVLGTHVEQAGSYVDSERLRFDFTHFSAMTSAEIEQVEAIVNEKIAENLAVVTREMSLEDARKSGAMALFGEKYGEVVRVVSMGDFSTELCGGTHVTGTGNIGCFKIVSEAGVAAGVRRIEALTGEGLLKYYAAMEKAYHEAAILAKTTPAALCGRISQLLEEVKTLTAENDKLKEKLAGASMGDIDGSIREIAGLRTLCLRVDGMDMNALRGVGDKLKAEKDVAVLVLASAADGKVNLIAMASEAAQGKGAHAGNLIKAIAGKVGGGGGGRPGMAQAGGKNPAGIEEALQTAAQVMEAQLIC